MSHLLDPYQPTPNPLLVVLSGPSGVGKDSVLRRMKERGYPFHFVITTTDRPPRPGEVHGRDYFFVSTQEFERMIAAGELLEHAVVYGQYKGISKAQVRTALESGQDVIMRIDVQGAATIRHLAPEAVFIFLSCESEAALVARLKARGTETDATLQARLAVLAQELQHLPEFDYLVINHSGRLDETVETIAAIIRAEKCRVRQRHITL
ncbi:MAG: guanylate kinase [Anaerolineae bacterium]|nr:guanylate kinase [Anaerolineae bacterium]MDW8070581.1 guanylate kinase [Anaerolineae bacterium]